jgi:hypothetical protein
MEILKKDGYASPPFEPVSFEVFAQKGFKSNNCDRKFDLDDVSDQIVWPLVMDVEGSCHAPSPSMHVSVRSVTYG